MMMRRPGWLRLLPIMIFVMSSLLALKSAQLVRAAVTTHNTAANVVSTAEAATPAEHPPPPQATRTRRQPTLPDETAPPPVTDSRTCTCCWNSASGARNWTHAMPRWPHANPCLPRPDRSSRRVSPNCRALQKKLESLDAARREREDTSWKGLVKVYEAMKPRDAATIFNDLETPVLLQVVDRMKEAKAAPVLAAMQPDKARDLTTKLAQMRTQRDTPAGS